MRRLFTLLSAGSLLLCVAAAVGWALSGSSLTPFEFQYRGERWQAILRNGKAEADNEPQRRSDCEQAAALVRPSMVEAEREAADLRAQVDAAMGTPAFQETLRRWERAEDAARNIRERQYWDAANVSRIPLRWWSVPLAWVVAATAVLPLTRWALAARSAQLRRLRAEARCCLACGYDLRATRDRCPECGAVQTLNT